MTSLKASQTSRALESEWMMDMHGGEQTKRIWICTFLPADTGSGVERFVALLSESLSTAGWDVQVVESSRAGATGFLYRKLRPLAAWKIGRVVNRLAGPRDVILCNGFFSWNARKSRSIVVFHGTELGRSRATSEVTTKLRNLAVRFVNARLDMKVGKGRRVVAVSEATKREIESLYRLEVHAVIPNAVDLDRYRQFDERLAMRSKLNLPKDKFIILYAGPPDPRKGFDFLVRDVAPSLRDTQLLVVTASLERRPKNILTIGWVSHRAIADYYQACDVIVMPSLYEGCSFALIEALACGLPFVVSPAGGASDLRRIDVLRPFVIDGFDVQGYVTALNRLEDSSVERFAVSSAARKHAEEYHGRENFARRYLELIDDCWNSVE